MKAIYSMLVQDLALEEAVFLREVLEDCKAYTTSQIVSPPHLPRYQLEVPSETIEGLMELKAKAEEFKADTSGQVWD